MEYSAKENISCPNCNAELGPVENYAQIGQDIAHIGDCADCNETFEVRDNMDGTFNVTC